MQARTIQEIAAVSGDSTLLAWKFEKGVLQITLELYDDDVEVTIYIPTDIVLAEKQLHKHESRDAQEWVVVEFEQTPFVFLELTELPKHLASCHGYFVPHIDFGQMMREVRYGHSLAYGRRANEFPWLLMVRGRSPIVACLVADLGAIRWEFEDD